MSYDQITTAVVGTGFIGPVHVEALKRLGVRVKGILGSTDKKSEASRKSMALEVAYDSIEEILADDEVDAVHLAVPNVLHYEMAKKLIAAGKHVMCEKPLAMNSQETQELLKLANASKVITGVTYNIRFYPMNLEARSRMQEDAAGSTFSVVGSYVQDWLMFDTDYNWRVLADKGGELRAVADIGTHWIDLVCFITGLEVESIFADLSIVHPVRKRPKGEIATFTDKNSDEVDRENVDIVTDDCGSILFRFNGGAKGQLWVSQVSAGRKNCLQYDISMKDTSLRWNSETPNELIIGHRNEPNQILLKDPSLTGTVAQHFINYPGGHNEGFPDTFKQCFRSFYDAILGKESSENLYPNFEDGHKEVLICEAILKSHREEKWIHINQL